DVKLTPNKEVIKLVMKAGNEVFGPRAAGSPFKVYAPGKYLTPKSEENNSPDFEAARVWDYAVSAGDELTDTYPIKSFKSREYKLHVHGPNGFYREFHGNRKEPLIDIQCRYEQNKDGSNKLTGNLTLQITNRSNREHQIQISDNSYGKGMVS